MGDHLFAYGFLMRRFHGNMQTKTPAFEAEFVAEGLYPGLIYRVDVYPGVIYTDDGSLVRGEIFKLTNPTEALAVLDQYENSLPLVTYNPDYQRRLRSIRTGQRKIDCWVYEYLKPIDPALQIHSGQF
ncbi:MAG: gamma-glutamylcyclotransferase family protein [Marinoscillum sp.]